MARRHFWRVGDGADVMRGDEILAPKISAIVPVYNVEPYLRQCLDSLVHQTLGDCEIIVVNDGSPDNSLEIIKEYAAEYPNVRYIDQPNRGLAAARNAGLRKAKGEYVIVIDSDDWVDVTMFEKLYDRAIATGADIVQCGYARYYQQDDRMETIEESWIDTVVARRKVMPGCRNCC